MAFRGDEDGSVRYPSTKEWFASDLKVEVRGNNNICLIAPCGDVRYFRPSQMQVVIEKLEAAMRKCRAEAIGWVAASRVALSNLSATSDTSCK